MAKDDYYVIVYQILAYLYQCLKEGKDIDPENLKPKKLFNINERYWLYILEHMQNEGLIEGFEKRQYINDQIVYEVENIQITPAGIGYLLDNSFIQKAKEFLKDAKSIVPFI